MLRVLSGQMPLGMMPLGMMLGAAALAGALFVPFSSLIGVAGEFARIRIELERANEVYAQDPEQATESARWVADSLSGRIELKAVSFRYGPHSPAVVDNISLSIQPSQMVALIGRSGCGKSTLARLSPRAIAAQLPALRRTGGGAAFEPGMRQPLPAPSCCWHTPFSLNQRTCR